MTVLDVALVVFKAQGLQPLGLATFAKMFGQQFADVAVSLNKNRINFNQLRQHPRLRRAGGQD